VVPPGGPAQIEVVQGDEQVGSAGLPLEKPVMVRLVDQGGRGVPDQSVTWVVSAGGGRVNPQTSVTNAEGIAWATWILGPAPGPHTLDAVVSEVGLVTFSAVAAGGDQGGEEPPTPSASTSTLSVEPSTIQLGLGTATITVVVRDGEGNPIPGAVVVLRASGDGNSITQPELTGPTGVATGTLSSSVAGTKVVSATVGGVVELNQTAEVTVTTPPPPPPAGPAVIMQLVEGDNQTAPAGSDVPVRPTVRLVDQSGQPLAGRQVTFVVTRGGGTVYGATQTTNGEGIARVGDWTLGASPGENRLEARASGAEGSPVVFTAQGTASGGVHHFVFRVQPHDVRVREWFTMEVAMVDERGNIVPLSGIEIYAGLFLEGYNVGFNVRLLGDRFRDTENGIAVFELAITEKGRYRFRALSDELPALGPHGPEPYLFSNWFEVK
jgi:Bacterial Ig-like domain (group 1)